MSDERRARALQHRYLGDGVYASFDGHHIWLRVGSHDSKALVALEPEVLEALVRYGRDVWPKPKEPTDV